eukprot:1099416-Rhodomonas_salina.1
MDIDRSFDTGCADASIGAEHARLISSSVSGRASRLKRAIADGRGWTSSPISDLSADLGVSRCFESDVLHSADSTPRTAASASHHKGTERAM